MLSLCAALSAPLSAVAQDVPFDDAAFVAATKTVESAPGRLSEEQRKRHEALDFARANVELSGGKISEEAAQRGLRWANGEITMDEYLAVSLPR